MRLHALVDGLALETATGTRLEPHQGQALFAGTTDAALAHAGPWLIDTHEAAPELLKTLIDLEPAHPVVSWLFTPLQPVALTRALQSMLDARLPDGRRVLIRFYDPRVLPKLLKVMTVDQHKQFFHSIHEWRSLDRDGQYRAIARP